MSKPANGNMTPTKVSPLAIMAERYNIEPDKLYGVLTKTILKPTDKHTPSMEEVAAFVIVANLYGLNPFTREIHAYVDTRRGGLVPIVGVDGWITLVNRHPDFDGMDFEEILDEEGKLYAMTCTIHVKGRSHPVRVTEYYSECVRPTDPWKSMPRRMLRHKVLNQAARVAFGFSGLYDEDEGGDVAAVRHIRAVASEPPTGKHNLRQLTKDAPAETVPVQDEKEPAFVAGDAKRIETTKEQHESHD